MDSEAKTVKLSVRSAEVSNNLCMCYRIVLMYVVYV